MKKIIVTVILILVSNLFFAQSVFDKFQDQEEVTSTIVNKKMFQMMGNVKVDAKDKEAQQYLNLIRKLDNLKVFSTTNSKISADMKITTDAYWKVAGLSELIRSSYNGKKLKIWYKSGVNESQIKEILMYNEGSGTENETILMSLTGDFSLNEISVLIDKMKIPGGEDLKNATMGM